jgi:hypothetical protein
MDVLTEEWFYVSLGLCGVGSLYVVVHPLHVVYNYYNGWWDSDQQADVIASRRKANQWIQGVHSDPRVSEGLIYN